MRNEGGGAGEQERERTVLLPLSIGRRLMKLYPAIFLLSLAATGAEPVAAQGFKPNKPIEFVVHTGPGGGNDLIGEHIRSGNVRVIAQIADRRLPPFPNVPTVQEAGFNIPNYAVIRGVVGPPAMPPDALAYWEEFFARLVQTPSWKKYLEDNLFEDGFLRGADLAKFNEQYPEQVRGILRDAGVKLVR